MVNERSDNFWWILKTCLLVQNKYLLDIQTQFSINEFINKFNLINIFIN